MNDSTRWIRTARRAAALAGLSHRSMQADRGTGAPIDTSPAHPWRWNVHDVWLLRINQPRSPTTPSPRVPSTRL